MKIWISSLRDVHDAHSQADPAHIVSLLSPGSDFPDFDGFGDDRHMRVEVHDILEDMGKPFGARGKPCGNASRLSERMAT